MTLWWFNADWYLVDNWWWGSLLVWISKPSCRSNKKNLYKHYRQWCRWNPLILRTSSLSEVKRYDDEDYLSYSLCVKKLLWMQSEPSSFFFSSQMNSTVCFRDVCLPVRHRVICKLTIYGRAKSQDVECAAPKPWIPARGAQLKVERKSPDRLDETRPLQASTPDSLFLNSPDRLHSEVSSKSASDCQGSKSITIIHLTYFTAPQSCQNKSLACNLADL